MDGNRIDGLSAAEEQELACEVRGLGNRILDLPEIFQEGIVPPGREQGKIQRTADRGENVVEVVGHASGKCADRFELLHLLKLRLENSALCNVLQHTLYSYHLPLRVCCGRTAEDEVPERSVLVNENPGIVQDRLPPVSDLLEQADILSGVLPAGHGNERLTDQLPGCVSEDGLDNGIHVGDESFVNQAYDDIR